MKDCMDVERFIVRYICAMVLNESINVKINKDLFRIKMMEDYHGSMRITLKQQEACKS